MALDVATVETAIEAILETGQSFTVDGITYNRGNVDVLYKIRDGLTKEALNTAGTRPLMRAFNFGSMGYASGGDGIKPTPVYPTV